MALRFVSAAPAHVCSLLKAENISYPGSHFYDMLLSTQTRTLTAFNTATYEQKLVPLKRLLVYSDDTTLMIKKKKKNLNFWNGISRSKGVYFSITYIVRCCIS